MQKAIVIFFILALISQAAIYSNPTVRGSNSPPGAGTDGSPNPYNYVPTPGASPAQNAAKQKFQNFKKAYGKYYQDNAEESYREALFNIRSKEIDDFNKGPDRGWKKGINQFTDMTDDQFQKTSLMPMIPVNPATKSDNVRLLQTVITPKDWTITYGAVWPVKNQGSCGSCWAFSAVGTLEANVAIKNSAATVGSYSEQQMVDCANSTFSCYGCGGGWPSNAWKYIGGIIGGTASSADYPYVSGTTKSAGACNTAVAKIQYLAYPWSSHTSLTPAMQVQLTTVSIAIQASGWSSYSSGIYSGCPNPITGVNHAVILVGVDSNGNYKIRNSWGSRWGLAGYMWISAINDCGVPLYQRIPVLL